MSMVNRRRFISKAFLISAIYPFPQKMVNASGRYKSFQSGPVESDFSKKLKPIGRILEEEGFYVWCNSPIYGEDGKVHVFYSRWPAQYGMGGWIHQCEIAHAVAESAESEFKHEGVVLAPREGFFDATTCHNPHIQFVDGLYCLFYMGNSNGKTNTKRIGLATSKSLNGPWKRIDKPLLEAGETGVWDDHCTTNPAFVKNPNGEYWLYYKSWNTKEYEEAAGQKIRGNRKYGLAIANSVTGPYKKYKNNPVIDFSVLGNNEQLEDAFVWYGNGKFSLIARDMGFFDHNKGLLFESDDGIKWSLPKVAYHAASNYFEQPPAPKHLSRYGRLERPQLLMKDGKPEYLFTTTPGGKYNTASGFVFKIEDK
jgi:hypothetical protein